MSITAPNPIFCQIDQPTNDGIAVALVQFLDQGVMLINIEVVPSYIPDRLLRDLTTGPFAQRFRPQLCSLGQNTPQALLAMVSHMLLKCLQQLRDRYRRVRVFLMRINQHVNMFRHDDIADQADAELLLQPCQSVDSDVLEGIVMKEGQTSIARDRPEMNITGLIIAAQARGHVLNITPVEPTVIIDSPTHKWVGHPADRYRHRRLFSIPHGGTRIR